MEFEYVPLGNSCSPAAAVQTLEIRKFALPFDWVMSTYNGICQCINEDFKNFHKHLRVESNKSRIVDYYNISFPHDYSTTTQTKDEDDEESLVGEGIISEYWVDEIDKNLEKYQRRIQRFHNIFNNQFPIIVLYRGSCQHIKYFQEVFKRKYNNTNIKYVVANKENINSDDIISCNPELNGKWNDAEIWRDVINIIKNKF